ncbi:MAG: hypothetical protein HY719_10250, partial [Planctomycetes bacterium]|nr:hypothetical protein [Planctomycetota bacterium]
GAATWSGRVEHWAPRRDFVFEYRLSDATAPLPVVGPVEAGDTGCFAAWVFPPAPSPTPPSPLLPLPLGEGWGEGRGARNEGNPAPAPAPPVVLAIDRSGATPPESLGAAAALALALLENEPPDRRFTVALFDGEVEAFAPAPVANQPEARARLAEFLAAQRPFGGSDLGAALARLGEMVSAADAKGARVVIMSDFAPTAGELGAAALVERARAALSGPGKGPVDIVVTGRADLPRGPLPRRLAAALGGVLVPLADARDLPAATRAVSASWRGAVTRDGKVTLSVDGAPLAGALRLPAMEERAACLVLGRHAAAKTVSVTVSARGTKEETVSTAPVKGGGAAAAALTHAAREIEGLTAALRSGEPPVREALDRIGHLTAKYGVVSGFARVTVRGEEVRGPVSAAGLPLPPRPPAPPAPERVTREEPEEPLVAALSAALGERAFPPTGAPVKEETLLAPYSADPFEAEEEAGATAVAGAAGQPAGDQASVTPRKMELRFFGPVTLPALPLEGATGGAAALLDAYPAPPEALPLPDLPPRTRQDEVIDRYAYRLPVVRGTLTQEIYEPDGVTVRETTEVEFTFQHDQFLMRAKGRPDLAVVALARRGRANRLEHRFEEAGLILSRGPRTDAARGSWEDTEYCLPVSMLFTPFELDPAHVRRLYSLTTSVRGARRMITLTRRTDPREVVVFNFEGESRVGGEEGAVGVLSSGEMRFAGDLVERYQFSSPEQKRDPLRRRFRNDLFIPREARVTDAAGTLLRRNRLTLAFEETPQEAPAASTDGAFVVELPAMSFREAARVLKETAPAPSQPPTPSPQPAGREAARAQALFAFAGYAARVGAWQPALEAAGDLARANPGSLALALNAALDAEKAGDQPARESHLAAADRLAGEGAAAMRRTLLADLRERLGDGGHEALRRDVLVWARESLVGAGARASGGAAAALVFANVRGLARAVGADAAAADALWREGLEATGDHPALAAGYARALLARGEPGAAHD